MAWTRFNDWLAQRWAPYLQRLEALPARDRRALLVLGLFLAVLLLGGLHLMLGHTPLGRRIRAVADDPATAQLLEWSARLHEIGLVIAHSQHHQHGAYLLEHSDIAGFSATEQQFVAALVRNQRRGAPAALGRKLWTRRTAAGEGRAVGPGHAAGGATAASTLPGSGEASMASRRVSSVTRDSVPRWGTLRGHPALRRAA